MQMEAPALRLDAPTTQEEAPPAMQREAHATRDPALLPPSEPRSEEKGASKGISVAGCSRARPFLIVAVIVCVFLLLPRGRLPMGRHRHTEPSTCLGGWPLFRSAAHLAADPAWSSYVSSVYGAVPQNASAYPWCTGDAWMFYEVGLADAGVKDAPASVGACPTSGGTVAGERYELNNRFGPANVTWSWHPAPYAQFGQGQWVEVMHRGAFKDEHVGAWFLYARGSGVWFNVGRSIVFGEHAEAHAHFGVGGLGMSERNEAMCANASAAGYDSIQFVAHTCAMMYSDCLNRSVPGLTYFNVEIVSTQLVGWHACASAGGDSPLLRAGWRGSAPCSCNNSLEFLNCEEAPLSTRATRARRPLMHAGMGMMGGRKNASL